MSGGGSPGRDGEVDRSIPSHAVASTQKVCRSEDGEVNPGPPLDATAVPHDGKPCPGGA